MRKAEDEEIEGGGSGGIEEGESGVEGAGGGPAGEGGEGSDDVMQQRLVGIAEGHAGVPVRPPAGVERVGFNGGGDGVEEGLDGIVMVGVFLGEETPGDEEVERE